MRIFEMQIYGNFVAILPIVILLTGAVIGLLIRQYRRIQAAWSFGVILLGLSSSLILLGQVWIKGQPIVYHVGGWNAPFGISIVADLLSAGMAMMSLLVISAGMLYALGCKDMVTEYPTFYPIFLLLGVGLIGGMLTGDLFNLFVFAELMVISATILTAISDDKNGVEAAYKYFYMSMVAGVFLLLSVGALYASYGTLNIADLANRIQANSNFPLVPIAIAFMLAFFMVKSAVVPFHFWQPDFHTAAPTPVHAVLSSVVVKLGIYGFLRMTTLLFIDQMDTAKIVLIILGVVGIFFGGLGATATYDAKRMLAYSTLGQLGFILIAIGWGSSLALMAVFVYSFNHSLLKAAMLMLAGTVSSRAPTKTAAFSAITGLGKVVPVSGILFLLGGMGLVGIPPMNGFISKLILLRSGIEAGEYLTLLLILIGSIITLVYVIRAYQKIWWVALPEEVKPKSYGDMFIAPAILIGLSLILGIWSEPLLQLAEATVSSLNIPAEYILAVLGD
jgi:multicomponent Na+:H+ antiporter subunit D